MLWFILSRLILLRLIFLTKIALGENLNVLSELLKLSDAELLNLTKKLDLTTENLDIPKLLDLQDGGKKPDILPPYPPQKMNQPGNMPYYQGYRSVERTDTQILIEQLFSDYNKDLRPVYMSSTTINLTIDIFPFQVLGLDEKNQILHSYLWQRQTWTDFKLQWNPKLFNGIDELRVPCSMVWLQWVANIHVIGMVIGLNFSC